MPQWDRYWLVGVISSLVLVAPSITLAVWYLASLVALPQLLGLPLLTDLGQMGSSVILSGGFGGWFLLSTSRAARKRVRARRRARTGDAHAVSRASILPDPVEAPPTSALPLDLVWRRKPRGREWVAPFIFTLLFGSVLGLVIVAVLIFGLTPQEVDHYLAPNMIGDFVATVLILGFDSAMATASLIALIVALTSPLGPQYGVVADELGISALHLKGRGPVLRWSEVRLVEVYQVTGQAQRVFSVYSQESSVYWEDLTRAQRKGKRLRVDPKAFEEHQRALLDLIAARTGHEPRTFSPALMRDEEVSSVPLRKYRLLAYGFGYGIAGVLLTLAVAVLALRLTHNALIDVYAALTCAAAGVGIGAIVRGALKPRTQTIGNDAQFTLPVAPPLGAEAMTVSYRRTLASRLHDAAIGLPLVLDIVPAFTAMASLTSSPPAPVTAFALHVVASLLFIVGIFGIVAILIALQSGRATITFDLGGLSERSGRKTVRIPWREIVAVTVALERRQLESFTVLSREGETITLPVRNVVWRASEQGQQLVTPEELAALVVARSGAPIVLKEA